MVGVHIRRGPWGYLHEPPAEAIRIRSLDELPAVLGVSFRVGIGVDAHALADGVPLVLGGVALDHPRGLAGHSDGDVLAHALIDALLGAAGLGDIGSLFPSGRRALPRRRQLELLREAYAAGARGGLDARQRRLRARSARSRRSRRTASEMRARLSDAVGGGEVNVRATTTDRLGFTGRGEGLAAHAVALLER